MALGTCSTRWRPEKADLRNRSACPTSIGWQSIPRRRLCSVRVWPASTGAENAALPDAYDFSGLTTIVDIGGATGKLLTTIVGKYPGSRGILFDLPHVVRDAPRLIPACGLPDRVKLDAGNFFERVPNGGDAYLLSHIIHDWAEDQCLSILRNCRQAMNPRSRLLIIETVLPADDTPHPGKMVDIVMLVAAGGQERTEQEYDTLLSKAGLRLTRVVPTESPVSVVEAVVA
jgi:O-methyltransferase domain